MTMPRLTIGRKLSGITILTLALALGLTYVILAYYERRTYEDLMVHDLPTQAEVTDFNCRGALSFRDARTAVQTLSALQADARILAAVLFDADGAPFASYQRPGFAGPLPKTAPALEGLSREDDRLTFVRRISMEGELLGTLAIVSDLREATRMLSRYAAIMSLVMVLSSLVGLALAAGLQRGILGRMRALADTARLVSEQKNYEVRVHGGGDDEVGQVVQAVNAMLDQIQARDVGLEAQAAELARSNADLEQYAYVASHDLQEPLRVIRSYAQLLGERYESKLDTDADQFISYITDSASRMQQLIDDLLAYARLGRDFALHEVSADAALDAALENLRSSIEETGATIRREPLPRVRSDPTLLTQLFQNLLSNALKFRGAEPPEIRVTVRGDEREYTFSVADNGIGIDEKFRDKIFALFKRLHSRKKYPGTGIGLGYCQKIVALHGGRIWVTSQPGAGATFHFTIPARKTA